VSCVASESEALAVVHASGVDSLLG